MTMRQPSLLSSSLLNMGMAATLLANMLADWRKRERVPTPEVCNEPQDHHPPPEQAGIHLPTAIHTGPSAKSSAEHRAAVRSAGKGPGTGLERGGHPHSGRRPGLDGHGDDTTGGFQDLGSRCLDGASGRSVCTGSLAAGSL